MTMTAKPRNQLKSYFVKNAIPTERNFADLIDAPLNQADDGIFRVPGEPLSVVAAAGDRRGVLRLYATYPAQNPDWQLSLNPVQDPNNPATARVGLGIGDAEGNTRLFVDAATGNLGVGTNNPGTNRLAVAGDARVEGTLFAGKAVTADRGLTVNGGDLVVNRGLTLAANQSATFNSRIDANAGLTVAGGPLSVSAGLTVGTGGPLSFAAQFRQMINVGAGEVGVGTQKDTLYLRSSGNFALFQGGIHNDTPLNAGTGGAAVLVVTGGNVGIGASSPGTNRLLVAGNARVEGSLTATGAVNVGGAAAIGAPGAAQNLSVYGELAVAGESKLGAVTAGGLLQAKAGCVLTGAIDFGAATRQMLNLHGVEHGVGVQASTTYFRTPQHFAFYQGGSATNEALQPGPGGAAVMVIAQGNVGIGTSSPGANRLQVEGSTRLNGAVVATGRVDANAGLVVATGQTATFDGPVRGLATRPLQEQQVHRRVLYGIAGDAPFAFDSTSPGQLMRGGICLGPFGYGVPPVQAGATRKFRLYAIYADSQTDPDNGEVQVIIRLAINWANDGSGGIYSFSLPRSWADPTMNRDAYSTWINGSPPALHGFIHVRTTVAPRVGRLYYLELQAYDVF